MGENKDADQLRGNREADQRLCFRYTDSTFPPLLIPKFSRSWVSSVTVQAGLCRTCSETTLLVFSCTGSIIRLGHYRTYSTYTRSVKMLRLSEIIQKIFILITVLHVTIVLGRKNVLFLVADDLRVQLGAYDGPNFASPIHPKMYTPNLDKLAAKSMVLKRAYVQQALCSPSRTSLLTGRRPDTTKIWDLDHYWRQVGGNFTTIPQYFKEHGYYSVGMGKIFHPNAASGHDDPISWSKKYWHSKRTPWEDTKNRSWTAVPDHELNHHPLVDKQISNHALYTLRSLAAHANLSSHAHKPFFMAVGFHRPHLPFVFPASMLNHYPQSAIHLPDNPYAPVNMPDEAWAAYTELRNFNDVKALHPTGNINTTLPASKVLELRRAYYSAVTWMDYNIGRILDELEKLNLADNTIISFFGDHGWQLGEHGEWCKHTNFDIATHAPMMIRVPGLTDSGKSTDKLTEFVDLFPTLVEAAELPKLNVCPPESSHVSHCTEGSSLMPLIRNPSAQWKSAAFSQYPRNVHGAHGQKAMGYTMTTSQYRYTEWVRVTNLYTSSYKPDWNTVYSTELYDHTKDPEENYNVADESGYAHIRQQLHHSLRSGWRSMVPGGHGTAPVVG